ncbi:MAG: dksA/traR C4-type zinc finger family protein [Saprospiraceae bacterium]|nr:MAG: dksA/traR C4-type zinc finger family protein [Saprospiraceae bacterium]
MTKEEREVLKQRILEQITQTEKEIVHLEEATQPISPENSIGRISRMDAINNKGVSEATLRSARRKMSNLQFALNKIDSPEFGICSRCKSPIPPARLMFMPQSDRCVRCADR